MLCVLEGDRLTFSDFFWLAMLAEAPPPASFSDSSPL